jgi:hypothetical protein
MEELEDLVPTLSLLSGQDDEADPGDWSKEESMNGNTYHMNTRIENVHTKDWKEKIEREQSQKLPGKGKFRAKFRKKRGVWAGKVFSPSHLASQQMLPVQGPFPRQATMACADPAGRLPAGKAWDKPVYTHNMAADKGPEKFASVVEGDLFQGKKEIL